MSTLGYKHSPETIARIRASNLGKHNFKHTEEAKEKISAATIKSQSGISKLTLLGEEKFKLYSTSRKEAYKRFGQRRLVTYRNTINLRWKLHPPTDRKDLRYTIWREECLSRDNHTCQHCGVKQEELPEVGNTSDQNLHVHHIKPWRNHEELRFDVSNGIILCPSCHRKEEHRLAEERKHNVDAF